MKLATMILREITFRKGNAAALFTTVFIAVALCAGSYTALQIHEADIRARLATKEEELRDQMKRMFDEYRKMTKDLGFNVLILPKDQNVADFYADNFASCYMPESYAATLAASTIVTVQHILPTLMQRAYWPEKKRSVMVSGVRGEASRAEGSPANQKKPIQEAVASGSVVCGYEIGKSLGLQEGAPLRFMGKDFTVAKRHTRRGNRDDVTLWMNLGEAQELFDKKGLINAILALECRCSADGGAPNLHKVRAELERALPGVVVIEFMSETIARAEARFAAFKTEETSLQQEKAHAAKRLERQEKFTIWFISLIALVAVTCTGFLTLLNVRARIHELAVMRALGLGAGAVLVLFEGRLSILGLCGASAACALYPLMTAGFQRIMQAQAAAIHAAPALCAAVIACATLITMLAGVAPVMYGIGRQPAYILKGTV